MTVRRALRAGGIAALLAIVLVAAGTFVAFAEPLSPDAFGARVDSALAAIDRAGSTVSSASVAATVAAEVEAALPLGLEVSEGTRTIVVADLPSVHGLANALRIAQNGADRTDAAAALRAHLVSMRDAFGAAGTIPSDPAALAALLAARPVTTGSGGNWLADQVTKLLEAIAKWLAGLSGNSPEGSAVPWRVLAVVVVAVPLVIALLLLARALVRRRARRPRPDVALPASDSAPVVAAATDLPADALAHADALAARGLRRDAVRALYGGAARHLVDAGLVTRMRTRTNHEMLRDVAAAAPDLEPAFGELTDEFEVAWYGHADPDADGFDRARRTYGRIVADGDGEQ